jgi:hypothetical protein
MVQWIATVNSAVIFSLAEELLASQEGLCTRELVNLQGSDDRTGGTQKQFQVLRNLGSRWFLYFARIETTLREMICSSSPVKGREREREREIGECESVHPLTCGREQVHVSKHLFFFWIRDSGQSPGLRDVQNENHAELTQNFVLVAVFNTYINRWELN